MFKKTLLKSFSTLIRKNQLKLAKRNFTNLNLGDEKNEFNFADDDNEFDFSANNEEENFQSEIGFDNQETGDLENLSMLLNPNNLQDIETFLNSLESDIPRQSIGIFLKVTCHILKRTKSIRDIQTFLDNPKLKEIIFKMSSYFTHTALDSEFVDYVQFLHLATTKGFRNKRFFGIDYKTESQFSKKFMERIKNENYDVRSLCKILQFEVYNKLIRRSTKIKLKKELLVVEQFEELEDFIIVRLFDIIAKDCSPLDVDILLVLLDYKEKILDLSTRNLVKIFNPVCQIHSKTMNVSWFLKLLSMKISENMNDIDIGSVVLLLDGLSYLRVEFVDFQIMVLEKGFENLGHNPRYIFSNIDVFSQYFISEMKFYRFKNQYIKFIEIIDNMDVTQIQVEKSFMQKQKLHYLINPENEKIRADLQPFFQKLINFEIERTGGVQFSSILMLLDKEYLEEIWEKLIKTGEGNISFYNKNLFRYKMIGVQFDLELPEELEEKISDFKLRLNAFQYNNFKKNLTSEQQEKLLSMFFENSIIKNFLFSNYFDCTEEEFKDILIEQKFRTNLSHSNDRYYSNVRIAQLLMISEKYLKENQDELQPTTLSNITYILLHFLRSNKMNNFKNKIYKLAITMMDTYVHMNKFNKELFEAIEIHLKYKTNFMFYTNLERRFIESFLDQCVYYHSNNQRNYSMSRIYSSLTFFHSEHQKDYFNNIMGIKEKNNSLKFNNVQNYLFIMNDKPTDEQNEILKELELKQLDENLTGKRALPGNNFYNILKSRFIDDEEIIKFLEAKAKKLDEVLCKYETESVSILNILLLRNYKNKSTALADYFKPKILAKLDHIDTRIVENMITSLTSLSRDKGYLLKERIGDIGYTEVLKKLLEKLVPTNNNAEEGATVHNRLFKLTSQSLRILNILKLSGIYVPEILEFFNSPYTRMMQRKSYFRPQFMIFIDYLSQFDVEIKGKKIEELLELKYFNKSKGDTIYQQILMVINNYEGERRTKVLKKHFKDLILNDESFATQTLLLWLKQNEPEIFENLENPLDEYEKARFYDIRNFKKLKAIFDLGDINYETLPKEDNLILANIYFPDLKIYLNFEGNKLKSEIKNKLYNECIKKINPDPEVKTLIINKFALGKDLDVMIENLKNLGILKKDINNEELQEMVHKNIKISDNYENENNLIDETNEINGNGEEMDLEIDLDFLEVEENGEDKKVEDNNKEDKEEN